MSWEQWLTVARAVADAVCAIVADIEKQGTAPTPDQVFQLQLYTQIQHQVSASTPK